MVPPYNGAIIVTIHPTPISRSATHRIRTDGRVNAHLRYPFGAAFSANQLFNFPRFFTKAMIPATDPAVRHPKNTRSDRIPGI